jgi:hypothetical protein
MKRRKQIGKLIYTPRWGQGNVELGEDYDGLSRDEKLDALSHWITALLSVRNEMIPSPKSWHHFMGGKEWVGLTDEELSGTIDYVIGFNSCAGWEEVFARAIEDQLRQKNT